MEIINFKMKKLKLLTKEQQNSFENAKTSYICKEGLKINILKIKNTSKYRGASQGIFSFKYI